MEKKDTAKEAAEKKALAQKKQGKATCITFTVALFTGGPGGQGKEMAKNLKMLFGGPVRGHGSTGISPAERTF